VVVESFDRERLRSSASTRTTIEEKADWHFDRRDALRSEFVLRSKYWLRVTLRVRAIHAPNAPSSEQRILCAKGHAHALWANHFGSLRPDALSLSLCRLARSAGSLPEKRQKAVPTDTTTDTTDAPSPRRWGVWHFRAAHSRPGVA